MPVSLSYTELESYGGYRSKTSEGSLRVTNEVQGLAESFLEVDWLGKALLSVRLLVFRGAIVTSADCVFDRESGLN